MKTRLLILVAMLAAAAAVHAGGFSFAWRENVGDDASNPNAIVHPIGYTGGNGQHLEIKVCIHSDVGAQQAAEMEVPIKNAIAHFNALNPELENTVENSPDVPAGKIDFESVFMHELGHCMGLAHPNLATEALAVDGTLSDTERRFAKAVSGTNGAYDLDDGADGVIGTADDARCDDVNTNWFRIADNDSFAYGSVFDTTTYSVDAGNPDNCNDNGDLPGSDSFVEVAGLQVAQERGLGSGEAVMYQGTRPEETQRNLNFDDAAMIRLAMSGADRTQDTSDDYTYELELAEQQGTHDDGCDITVNMTGSNFGVCRVSAFADFPEPDHYVLAVNAGEKLPRIEFDPTVDWHFNTTLTGGILFQDRFEQ